jgi:hypothetical protein
MPVTSSSPVTLQRGQRDTPLGHFVIRIGVPEMEPRTHWAAWDDLLDVDGRRLVHMLHCHVWLVFLHEIRRLLVHHRGKCVGCFRHVNLL